MDGILHQAVRLLVQDGADLRRLRIRYALLQRA
jgi:hypothetical protein